MPLAYFRPPSHPNQREPRAQKMVQIDTKNIHAYCEPSLTIFVAFTFGFAHPATGLAFVACWGIILFGYDTLALPFTLLVPGKVDVGCAGASGEGLLPRTSSRRSTISKIPVVLSADWGEIVSPQALVQCFRLELSSAHSRARLSQVCPYYYYYYYSIKSNRC